MIWHEETVSGRTREVVCILTEGADGIIAELATKEKLRIAVVYVARRAVALDFRVRHLGEQSESEIRAAGVILSGAEKRLLMQTEFVKGCIGSFGRQHEEVVVGEGRAVPGRNISQPVMLCAEKTARGEHGAGVGKIDGRQLLYLMNRGIAESEARKLLIFVKLISAVKIIKNRTLREGAEGKVRELLASIG